MKAANELFAVVAFAALTLGRDCCAAETLPIEVIKLPPLFLDGKEAVAHTQGVEVLGGKYFVTARLESSRPKRALLLRAEPAGTNWDIWDVTAAALPGAASALDHPGGIQNDGKRLWVPVAASKPKSQSVIRVFALNNIVTGQPLKPEFEFSVQDHIGAVAVSSGPGLVFGANWDTETVYVWDLDGRLKQTLSGDALDRRGLGLESDAIGGVAIQDWKVDGDRLFASGLARPAGSVAPAPRSRWLVFTNFLQPDFQRSEVTLPLQNGTELAREAMAVSGGFVYFLPEDLRENNRLFRIPLARLLQRAGAGVNRR